MTGCGLRGDGLRGTGYGLQVVGIDDYFGEKSGDENGDTLGLQFSAMGAFFYKGAYYESNNQ